MKKRIKSVIGLLLTLAIVLSIAPLAVFAQDDILDYLTYDINDGEVTITDCDDSICGKVVIPDTIEGYPVTKIGAIAFGGCDSLTEITIPDSVRSIGDVVFKYCTSLTSITVDENNANYSSDEYGVLFNKDKTELIQYPIGNSRTDYIIPDSVTLIDDYAFFDCSSLTEITIPDSVTTIGAEAFSDCESLENIAIPDSVTSIGERAFGSCDSLTEITIPDSVTSIDDYVFYSCDSLTEIIIPDSVTSIGEAAFCDCTNLTEIIIPDSVTSIEKSVFSGCTSLTEITIPDSVTSIDDYVFYSCDSLTEITIPDSVTSIGEAAFCSCSNLTEITIPDSVTSIGDWAFGYYHDIYMWEYILIDNAAIYGYTGSEAEVYADENGITFVVIESEEDVDGPDEPAEDTPVDCLDYLTYEISDDEVTITDCRTSIYGNVVIPDTIEGYPVRAIGNYAFMDCVYLLEITIPDSVTSIGYHAFADCESLIEITIPEGVTSIDEYAFSDCESLTGITIPEGVTSIGNYAFYGCTTLTNVIFPGSITSIGDNVFYYCENLMDVEIPDSVTSIGDSAFSDCYNLTEVIIPDSVTSIDSYAFSDCYNLTEVIIPDSVTSIGGWAFGYYFDFETGGYELIDDFVIYGYTGSEAEVYADENGISFVSLTDEPATDEPVQDVPTELIPNADSGNITVIETVVNITAENSVEDIINSVENENVQILDKEGNELTADAFVGTGSKINILDNAGYIRSSYEVMVKADINGDGKITTADARLALRAAVGLDSVSGVYEIAANYDDKGSVATSDARLILRKAVGLD